MSKPKDEVRKNDRAAARDDFPGETFRVLKDQEIKQYGEYRTQRLVLEKWDGMQAKS